MNEKFKYLIYKLKNLASYNQLVSIFFSTLLNFTSFILVSRFMDPQKRIRLWKPLNNIWLTKLWCQLINTNLAKCPNVQQLTVYLVIHQTLLVSNRPSVLNLWPCPRTRGPFLINTILL